MITRPDHAALSVRDLKRSLAFYRDALGFKVARILECGPDTGLGDVVGMPGCRARIAHLECGGGMLELFEYQQPRGRPVSPDRSQADHGLIHVGFTSTDVRGDYARLKELGIRFLSEPLEFRPGVWIVYGRGPDDEVFELRETPETPEE